MSGVAGLAAATWPDAALMLPDRAIPSLPESRLTMGYSPAAPEVSPEEQEEAFLERAGGPELTPWERFHLLEIWRGAAADATLRALATHRGMGRSKACAR